FVVLDSMPLTPNGKLNRRALPEPDFTTATSADYQPPRTEIEHTIAAAWADVLGVDRVGVHDNFFELGGDSLLSIRVVSRVRAALGVNISPRALFTAPTVAGVAATLGTETSGVDSAGIVSVPRDGELPLSFAQQRLW